MAALAALLHTGASCALKPPLIAPTREPTRASIAIASALASKPPFEREAFNEAVMSTYGRFDLAVSHGKGCKLCDTEGNEYLDFAAGISTCTLGHADERLAAAVSEQMLRVHHVSNLYYIPQQGELARKLLATNCLDRAFFCNSGAEANEAAIKLARKHAHDKRGVEFPVIITALSSFHGRTLATITATGQPKYQEGFGPMMPGFEYVAYNDVAALEEAARKLTRRLPLGVGRKKQLAAIMLEPLQGEGGIRPGERAFFEAARRICDETGALLIVDEVQTGVCRTGCFWGYQQLGIEVDVLTSAKALGGGVPIGAMMAKAHCDVFTPGTHATTYGGNPLACAAGLAVLAAIDERALLDNVKARGEQLSSGLRTLQAAMPSVISDVRGWGLIVGIEMAEESFSAAALCSALLAKGMLTVPAGTRVLRLVPPLVVSEEEVASALGLLEAAIRELASPAT
uniref:acetylornithine transaminase n=1 Tax=Calcidiscus leptoporus TaxID=127549 RepID=A0A7S0NZY0_9EUKA